MFAVVYNSVPPLVFRTTLSRALADYLQRLNALRPPAAAWLTPPSWGLVETTSRFSWYRSSLCRSCRPCQQWAVQDGKQWAVGHLGLTMCALSLVRPWWSPQTTTLFIWQIHAWPVNSIVGIVGEFVPVRWLWRYPLLVSGVLWRCVMQMLFRCHTGVFRVSYKCVMNTA